jgi:aminomethyltransferase
MMLARDDQSSSQSPLKRTPLHALHAACGGKMVPFAGYDMPVQFSTGVLREHLHTRCSAGLFDVSHMGQIALRPKSGRVEDAALALERLVPQDILGVTPGRQRYAQFTNAAGGILDDLMVANFGSHLFLVVNAACRAADEAHLRADRAARAEGRIRLGKIVRGCARHAVHGRRSAPCRRHRLLRLALRLHRRGRL